MKLTSGRLRLFAMLLFALVGAFMIFLDSKNAGDERLMTTEPRIVQSYTITRHPRATVIVEVWEMEYKGETIRSLHFDNTGISNELSTIRFMLNEMEKSNYEHRQQQYD